MNLVRYARSLIVMDRVWRECQPICQHGRPRNLKVPNNKMTHDLLWGSPRLMRIFPDLIWYGSTVLISENSKGYPCVPRILHQTFAQGLLRIVRSTLEGPCFKDWQWPYKVSLLGKIWRTSLVHSFKKKSPTVRLQARGSVQGPSPRFPGKMFGQHLFTKSLSYLCVHGLVWNSDEWNLVPALSLQTYLFARRSCPITCGRLDPFGKAQDPFRKRVYNQTGGKIPTADFSAKPHPHAKNIAKRCSLPSLHVACHPVTVTIQMDPN